MNQSPDKALHYLTGKQNIDAVTVEELDKFVNDHPYFPIAHFLLAKKLNDENDQRFLSQVQKTALYFPNPYWLHFQLLNEVPEDLFILNEEQYEEDKKELPQQHRHHSIIIDKDQLQHPVSPQTNTDHTKEDAFEEPALADENQHPMATEFSAAELETDNNTDANNFETSNNERSDVTETDPKTFAQNREPAIDVHENKLKETFLQIPETNDEEVNNLSETKDDTPEHYSPEKVSQPEEEMAAITRHTDETTEQFLEELENSEPEKESNEQTAADAVPIGEISSPTPPQTLTEVEEPEPDEAEYPEVTEETDEHEKMFQNIKAMLDASAKEANADTKNAVLPIDPYYTIDYFASQGIKLDLKKTPPDKVGKQVKKFTQWLKHMKKLGPEDALASQSVSTEEDEAQRIAEASNTAREVVTEAMALVLEKQGKKDKAVQLYRKLTFLNPDKSAYFAAKIKNLNGT